MLNIGGGEFLVIMLVALVVLGPTKLPEAARQVGKVLGEFRNISSGFQRELRDAMKDPVERATREVRKDVESIATPPVTTDPDTTPKLAPSGEESPVDVPPEDPPIHGDR